MPAAWWDAGAVILSIMLGKGLMEKETFESSPEAGREDH